MEVTDKIQIGSRTRAQQHANERAVSSKTLSLVQPNDFHRWTGESTIVNFSRVGY